MKIPCENAIWYVLPRIRADLARELVKKGMSQNKIAERLGITPAAISQYLHKKRGGRIEITTGYKRNIVKAAKEIRKTKDSNKISKLICQCCMGSRSKLSKG